MTKAEKIKQARLATKEKRKSQIPVVYQLKLNLDSVSQETRNRLFSLFLEAKWLYNYIVADIENRLNAEAYKLKKVQVKVGENYEEREIVNLSVQMRQAIVDRIRQNLYALHKQKTKGYKVGKLRFKKQVNSIPLKQVGKTFKFVNKQKTRVKIEGFKKAFRVLGGHQIPASADIAKAELVKKPSGIYLFVTCYIDKEKYPQIHCTRYNKKGIQKQKVQQKFEGPIGIDFKPTGLVLSNGIKIEWIVKETKKLKRLQKKLARQKRGSKNWHKTKNKIARLYEKMVNIKRDIINKVLALLYCYQVVCYQNDSIKRWKDGLFSKSVHYSAVGTIKRKLRNSFRVPTAVLECNAPTTKTCSRCGAVQKITLSDRIFKCPNCGLEIDRDLNSALNMIKMVGLDRPEVTPVEHQTAARILGTNPYILVSLMR